MLILRARLLRIQFLLTAMQNFEVLSKVGEGAFATVYKGKRKQDGAFYAMKKIKFMNRTSREIANCLNEVRILASITNPYVLAYKQAFYHEPENSLVLITEFATGGDLTSYIKQHQREKQRIPEEDIWRIAIQLLFGLRALHRLNVFHRDVKSANILLSGESMEARLGDLNVSKVSKSGLACTQTGTPYYASPEVWGDLPYTGKCDIWSLGCVLYEMATFRPPFLAADLPSLRNKIEKGSCQRIPDVYSQDLDAFIRLCLAPSPKERPSADGLLHNSIVRRRLYCYPNEKFNQPSFDLSEKENKLLQTIRPSKRESMGSELKLRLPKSNYESDLSSISTPLTERKMSTMKILDQLSEKLPLLKRNSSIEAKEKPSQPWPRLAYLR